MVKSNFHEIDGVKIESSVESIKTNERDVTSDRAPLRDMKKQCDKNWK